jgi:hypothetical protein
MVLFIVVKLEDLLPNRADTEPFSTRRAPLAEDFSHLEALTLPHQSQRAFRILGIGSAFDGHTQSAISLQQTAISTLPLFLKADR